MDATSIFPEPQTEVDQTDNIMDAEYLDFLYQQSLEEQQAFEAEEIKKREAYAFQHPEEFPEGYPFK